MRSFLKLSIPTVAVALLLTACGGGSSSGGSPYGGGSGSSASPSSSASSAGGAVTVKSTRNSSLGSTVLVDQHGLTLYRLSGEKAGKFICTAACLKIWRPLTVSAGGKPAGGVGGLGVLGRPDGSQQVTYKGMPLYTFGQDRSPGQAKGQGIKDVGTWNAVSTSASTSSQAPASGNSAPSSGGRYAY